MIKIGFFALTSLITANTLANTTPVPDVSPVATGQQVVINIPQQRLFLFTNGKLTKAYPVAVGKALTQTNLGEHIIGPKAFNPTWHIPKSIQKERNDGVKTIPHGPNNPLGPVFVRMGDPKLGLGIHGTNAPSSVPGVRSHGCVRMKSPDALEFANTINTGSTVSVVYHMANLNADANNNIWLAAYRDPYSKKNLDTDALRKSIAAWAKAHGKVVHSKRLDAVLKARTGAANCLTCAKGEKIKGSLSSISWTTGSANLTKAKPVPIPPPALRNEVLPEGTEIEVEEESTQPEAGAFSSSPMPTQSTRPVPATTPREPSSDASPVYVPININDGTENLF